MQYFVVDQVNEHDAVARLPVVAHYGTGLIGRYHHIHRQITQWNLLAYRSERPAIGQFNFLNLAKPSQREGSLIVLLQVLKSAAISAKTQKFRCFDLISWLIVESSIKFLTILESL